MLNGMLDSFFINKKILLCACGSVAAYKAADLASSLKKEGASVTVILTESAKKFVTPLTLELITENPVFDGFFEQSDKVPHVNLAKEADLILVAPATADYVARIASGRADDLCAAVVLGAKCPVLIAPAMNSQMLENVNYQENVSKLTRQGKIFIEPEDGWLACGELGKGRLAGLETIKASVEKVLQKSGSLKKVKFLVAYGPTIEKIDEMRYISNLSSGFTGKCIVDELIMRGAEVIAVSGPTQHKAISAAKYIEIQSAAEMQESLKKYFHSVDCLIMAAAVADYTVDPVKGKIKRLDGDLFLRLKPTDDILKMIATEKKDQYIVGFCAEHTNLIQEAVRKLKEKTADMIIANPIGVKGLGPGAEDNEVFIISADSEPIHVDKCSKKAVAEKLVDHIAEKLL